MAGIPLVQAMFAAPLVGINKRWPRVLHAIEMDEIVAAWPNRTATAACGATKLRAIRVGGDLAEWPIAARLPEPYERCRECWVATGKKRPRSLMKV